MNTNQDLSKAYWEKRYNKQETGWDIGGISPPMKFAIDQLAFQYPEQKDLSILIPGAGLGHEAIYLHQKGYTNVHVLDIAKKPLAEIALNYPDFPSHHLHCEDFFNFKKDTFDIIFEQTFFCAIPPSSREMYVLKIHELLKPKGILTGLFFNFPLTDQGPPFGGSIEEYLDLFDPYFLINFMETAQNSIKPRAEKELFFIFENRSQKQA